MSIPCPHRHLSYSQWRQTIYRSLFALPVPASTSQSLHTTSTVQKVKAAEECSKKRLPPKKWDPYSKQARKDLQAVVQQLQQQLLLQELPRLSSIQSESADQVANVAAIADGVVDGVVDFLDLPQSPVFDRALRQRKRQRPVKRQPATAEERALENDPWAAMLAQPVRMEIATRARLPSALMANWALVKHPDTHEVYVLPDSLADVDSLDKMGMDSMVDVGAQQQRQWRQWRQRRQRQPDQTARTAAKRQNSSRHSALLNPGTGRGPVIRVLPSAQLMDRLTQMYTFVERPGSPSSPRIMRLSIDLTSLLPQLWRERVARVRHYDASRREVEARTGNPEPIPPCFESTVNKANLKWQPDIEHRLLMILRTRLAACLRRVLQLADPSATTDTGITGTRTSSPIRLEAVLVDLLKKGGHSSWDVDAAALRKNEQLDLDSDLDPSNQPRNWGPYSPARILLYFSDEPADQVLSELPTRTPVITAIPGSKPTTYTDESETAQQKVAALLPPLLPLSHHHLPIFPMRALLGDSEYNTLVRVIRQSTGHWLPWETATCGRNSNRPHILSITADAAYADVLFSEIWRLWRYVGGSRCITK